MEKTIILCPKGSFFTWNHCGISDEWRKDVLENRIYPNTKYRWKANEKKII